ncbi:MAG TPA: hypothetical protein VHE61_15400 [Opitutaceae bacterium]|nr:hypothetical protein [Opitutaceae bacterium]
MRAINRIVFVCFIILGALWIGAYVVDLKNRHDDVAFYRTQVEPSLRPGSYAANVKAIDEWLNRTNRHDDNEVFRLQIMMVGAGLLFGWTILSAVRTQQFWKRRNAANRPADTEAGTAIRDVRQLGSHLVASATKRGLHFLPFHEREVEVDFPQRVVVFRGFVFLTRFAGNSRPPACTLPFTEILGGRVWTSRDGTSLSLRTTAGRVTITDDVQPFQPLVAVLLDIAELNRKDPAAYAAALAREPKITTPWYGWLIFALALTGVALLAWFLWHLQPK